VDSTSISDCIQVVQMLIQAGADVNLKGGKNTSPLKIALASHSKDSELIQMLHDASLFSSLAPKLGSPK
jgi:hypothetical protein